MSSTFVYVTKALFPDGLASQHVAEKRHVIEPCKRTVVVIFPLFQLPSFLSFNCIQTEVFLLSIFPGWKSHHPDSWRNGSSAKIRPLWDEQHQENNSRVLRLRREKGDRLLRFTLQKTTVRKIIRVKTSNATVAKTFANIDMPTNKKAQNEIIQ